jgi:hypothetical protein
MKKRDAPGGIALASSLFVPETSPLLSYTEPVVMWRMRRADGLLSHAMMGARSDGATVVWFINDRPLGYRIFDDWTSALRWSDQMQKQNWAMGWRVVSDEAAPRQQ